MQRQSELQNWLHSLYPDRPFELAFAAADADFRRYFRATFSDGQTVICMDAPPDKMSIAPYLKVQKLFSMLNVPQVYHADETLGFAALSDLGSTTYLAAMQHDCSGAAKELGKPFNFKQKQLWQQVADVLLPPLLAQPQVFVHRDYIVRNLMLSAGRPGVLDFQDALYGPISYDLVSLLRDAFIEWEEEFVLDLVIRYWEKARAAGLPVPAEFDEFYRWFEWMGVQRHLKVAGIFARLYHRDGKDKYRPEIPRFLNYLRRASRRYTDLAPLYALLVDLVGDDELETGYTF